MVKYNLTDSMIGNMYTFFLSNMNFKNYYMYRIYSPSLSPDCIPYLSLEKIDEKTTFKYQENDNDLISYCLNGKKVNSSQAVDFLSKTILKKENPVIDKSEKNKFPLIEMENGTNIQKSLIINIRDNIRWKHYDLSPGKLVDVLWNKDSFVFFEICERKKGEIELKPISIYKNNDSNLKNEIPISGTELEKFKSPIFIVKSDSKAIPDINKYIKKIEWESFGK